MINILKHSAVPERSSPSTTRPLRRTHLGWGTFGRALALAVPAVLVTTVLPPVASANDLPIGNVHIVSPLQQEETMTITTVGDVITSVGGYVLPGCYDSEVGLTCFGNVNSDERLNTDGSGPPTNLQGGPYMEQRAALRWIVDEAIVSISASYDIPVDARIERYAAAEIRARVVNRILDIIDRTAYNVALTENEEATLELIQDEILTVDRKIAEYAYDEYQRFKAQGCAYERPPAPAFVTEPLEMPADVVHYCGIRRNPLTAAFDFMPPQPSEQHFTTWGVYRQASELGLDSLSSPELQQNLVSTIAGVAFGGGAAAAATSAGVAGGVVGASATASKGVVSFLGSMSASTSIKGWSKALLLAAKKATAAGAVAGAVAAVLLFIIIFTISVWMLAEYEQVGKNLSAASSRAKAASDALGLAALKEANQGKEFPDGMDPDNLPFYRQPEAVVKLTEMVTRWMTVGLGGAVQADITGVWADNSSTINRDHYWEITDAQGRRVQTTLRVPHPDGGPAFVRFNRSWMIVREGDDPEYGALKFAYKTADGEDAIVVRRDDGGFIQTIVQEDEAADESTIDDPTPVDSIEFHDVETGELVSAKVVVPGTRAILEGPRPTVQGTLVAGWVHNLRPNPIDTTGHFDLDRFREDYEFEWQLERYDSATNTWVDVPLLPPLVEGPVYGARFRATETGRYRGHVTMTSLIDATEPEATGTVDFEIRPPENTFEEAVLVDDGFDELRVDLHLAQNTPSGQFDVTVRWPGELGTDEAPETTLQIDCLPQTLGSCDTPRTANVPVLRQALTHQLSPLADLSAGVEVTVTNQHGGVVSRTLAIDHGDRPRSAPPPGPAAGQPNLVLFDPHVTDVQIPVASPTVSPEFVLATIEPGASDDPDDIGFSVYDPETGTVANAILLNGNPRLIASVVEQADGQWVLSMHAMATMDDIGAYIVPIGIQQNNGRRTTMLLHLDIVPAPDSKYRVFLESDVDPADFAVDHLPEMTPVVVNGRADWEPYSDELCVSLLNTNTPGDPVEKCAPIEELRSDDGELTFPWTQLAPRGIEVGIHQARAWLADTDRSWPEPHRVSFFMQSGAPRITELEWDNRNDRFTLGVEPWSASAPVDSVSCTLDEASVECFEPAGGTWTPDELSLGSHRLDVVVTDVVGNYDTAELEFEVTDDTTPPVIEATVDGTVGEEGWYVSDVSLAWTVTDEESDVTETDGCDLTVIDDDTTGEDHTCTATSEGGTASATVTIKRDVTPPVVAVSGVDDDSVYTLGEVPEAVCDTADETSGVAADATIEVTGGEADGTGRFTATCDGATDVAGNAADAVSVDYMVLPAKWDPATSYQAGDRISYNGIVYEAAWWAAGQQPGVTPWGPWQEIATAPDGTAIWTASRIFDTGDVVMYEGNRYHAKWWTRNQPPGDRWGPWEQISLAGVE
jgi:chitodextrinase